MNRYRRALMSLVAFACGVLFATRAMGMRARDYFHDARQEALAEAAASGNVGRIDSLLRDGASVNYQGEEGMTALLWAFMNQNRRGYEYLLQKGANPNLQMTESKLTSDGIIDGASVMWLAARHEDSWFLAVALAHGGDPNVPNSVKGTTPVFECISMFERSRPNLRMDNLRRLIAAGAKLDVFSRIGLTPLARAAALNRYDMVLVMLKAGADPNLARNPRLTLASLVARARTDPQSEAYQWRTRVIEELASRGIAVRN